jgi:raffinose/stachyose/melibiose transport system permease protein
MSRRERREHEMTIVVFLAPTLLILGTFVVWPILSAFRLSLFDWNGVSPTRRFVGLQHWQTLVADRIFWKALGNNGLLVVLSIITQMPVAMALATLLERGGRKLGFFKTVYFFPMLMSTVAVGIVFKYIYDPQFGLVNELLTALSLPGLRRTWLGDPSLALFAVAAVISWQSIPFYMMLFLAALVGIPRDLRDAASLDGATGVQYFRHVAWPLIRGTVRTAVILSILGSLRYFDLIWVMTEGGPSNASELMATYMYRQAFAAFDMGYGSTIASAMFVFVMVVGGLSLWFDQRAQARERR